jgi:hypothetical protein
VEISIHLAFILVYKPKLTNGFVTVTEKELERGFKMTNAATDDNIVYSSDDVNKLLHKYLDDHSTLNTYQNHAMADVWFNKNKKK